jgi:hypothetical protein
LQQLQNRGASKSRVTNISETEAKKKLIDNPEILANIARELYGQEIDVRKETALFFPLNGKTIFYSHLKQISASLDSVLVRKDGQPFIPPVVDVTLDPSLSPVHQRVSTTDSEIILVPLELMVLSNLVARSLAIILNPRNTKGDRIEIPSPSSINLSGLKQVYGLKFLATIIYCHIRDGESYRVPLPPIGKRHEPLRSWILEAIETFAIAHEYGHFVAGHAEEELNAESRIEGIAPNIAREVEADMIGQQLCALVGYRTKNILLNLNIGAIILIHIGEYIRQARSILHIGRCAPESDTHPSPEERINALQMSSAVNFCEQIPEAVKLQQDYWRVLMKNIWHELEMFYCEHYQVTGPLDVS